MELLPDLSTYKTKNLAANLPTQIAIICHLMTCYTIKPRGILAINISRHMEVLLNSPAATELGEWKSTFLQLQIQWNNITQRHRQQQQQQLKNDTESAVPHS